jgi:hypothetical protein
MWESRVLSEISKLLWKSIGDFHGSGISTAANLARSSPTSWTVPDRREATRLPVNASKFHPHEAHDPIAVFRFCESDGLASQRRADKH